jgi:hypothetical protein
MPSAAQRKRARAASITVPIGNHSFQGHRDHRLSVNGGIWESELHDRTKERLTQDEVERIRL